MALRETPLNRKLCMAAEAGQRGAILDALDAGASPDSSMDNEGALQLACLSGSAECVALLLARGADPNLPQAKDGHFALHLCANNGRIDLCQMLLAKGARADPRDHRHYTPLHHACMVANPDCVKLLLARGADPDAATHLSRRPMDLAAMAIHEQPNTELCLRWLVEAGAKPGACGDSLGSDPMLALAMKGWSRSFQILLALGCPLDGRDAEGKGILHMAARGGSTEILNLCLAAGMRPDALDREGRSPLFDAARLGRMEALLALAKAGAEIDLESGMGMRALHAAIENVHPAAAALLVELGADPAEPVDGCPDAFAFAQAHAGDACVDALREAWSRVQAREVAQSTPEPQSHDPQPRL